MNILKATKRTTQTAGQINKLRAEGVIPAVLYGGKQGSVSISLKKLHLINIMQTDTFMSKVVDLEIEGTSEKALPRDIAYHPISDEPIHIDFMRIVKGSKLVLQIPVKFINLDKSPGLKKGGVLNTVRRKVELKCPAENIPNEIVVDLNNTDIGTSIKISSIKLPENVIPTITDRDFVIATVVAPTVIVEPVKPEETPAEGDVAAEGAAESSDDTTGEAKADDNKDKSAKTSGDKTKPAQPDKSATSNKDKERKK